MPAYTSAPPPISSTRAIPPATTVPRHIAIVMDGNGRWAQRRHLPRVAGHARGLASVRRAAELCLTHGVSCLTLFAFSSENWRRPPDEVDFLMKLFHGALDREVDEMVRHDIRLQVIGNRARFSPRMQAAIAEAEARTAHGSALNLSIAADYGGRWDILQAVNRLRHADPTPDRDWHEEDLLPQLCLGDLPEPDLFIRTGGEQRISNFLLWQLAYAEFHFTDCLWPEFDAHAFASALTAFRQRERRFGRTSAQLTAAR
jgi:undecaprenyl diphosphate synthase